ncbi:MAG TPA: hypothetical protein VM261_21250 [Kofleriaceae bacterium]|nr:hypothetical protein [Kofleriaceae bacterium]
MKRSVFALVLLMMSSPASSAFGDEEPLPPEPVGKLTPPPGWEADVGRSKGLELAAGNEDHFGAVPVHVSAQHLRAPQPGGILLTTEIATVALPANLTGAASMEMHGLRAGLDSLGETVKVARWEIRADAAQKLTEGRLEWSDSSLGTTTVSRTLVFKTGDHLVRLSADCIIAADAGALRGPCEAALATLAPIAPVSARELVEVSATPPLALAATDVAKSSGPTIRELDGEMPVTIVVDKPKAKPDRRPYYVFGGLAVILAVFLLNRRNRQRLEEKS